MASEDTVAVLGVGVALVGTVLYQLTRNKLWDGLASLVIAGLLAYVAFVLGRDTKELLIGESADPEVRLSAYDVLVSSEQVVAVKELLTMQLGPAAILVAARVEFDGDLLARELEQVCTELAHEMRRRTPDISQATRAGSKPATLSGRRRRWRAPPPSCARWRAALGNVDDG